MVSEYEVPARVPVDNRTWDRIELPIDLPTARVCTSRLKIYVDDLLAFLNNLLWVDMDSLRKILISRFRIKDPGLASKILDVRVTKDACSINRATWLR